MNQGSSQLKVAYTRTSVSLPHKPRNQKQTKKEDTKIPAAIQTSGEGRKGTDQSKHSQHFQGLVLHVTWIYITSLLHYYVSCS